MSDERINHYGHDRLKWKGLKLYFGDRLVTELIPHDSAPKMYHLKFFWRDDKIPEYFNIIWARENARVYSLQHLNYEV